MTEEKKRIHDVNNPASGGDELFLNVINDIVNEHAVDRDVSVTKKRGGGATEFSSKATAEGLLDRRRIRGLMEQSPLAIEILTPAGKISQVNEAWMRLWGFNEDESAQVLANYNMLTDKQLIDQGIMPKVEEAFAGQSAVLLPFKYDGILAVEEMGLDHLQMRSPWIRCHLYSVKDVNGEIDYVVNIYMDITELKQAEQEVFEQREALARVDRTSSMGQLTGSISHELNQPLTGILSNAQAAELMIESGQWDSAEMAEIMAEIVADAKRARDVIHNLRQLYREQQVELLPIDISAVVEKTTKLLHSEFIIERVELTTGITSHLPWVNGNRTQIQQVLVNLILNAIQAMQDMAHEKRRIHIMTSYNNDEVKTLVEDTGTGIDSDRMDLIFEPLATWKPGHMGMGLAISDSIIRAHGGRIWAENRSEGGARVGFTLPVPKEEEGA